MKIGLFKNCRWYFIPAVCFGLEPINEARWLFLEIYFLNRALYCELKIA